MSEVKFVFKEGNCPICRKHMTEGNQNVRFIILDMIISSMCFECYTNGILWASRNAYFEEQRRGDG